MIAKRNSISVILTQLHNGEVSTDTPITPERASKIIEYMLTGFPCPSVYLTKEGQILHGHEIVSAIYAFMVKKSLILTELNITPMWNAHSYDQLPRSVQRKLEEYPLMSYLITSPKAVTYIDSFLKELSGVE